MSGQIAEPTILVIFGITGDLAGRMLLPAIAKIAKAGILPESFKVVGVSRREVSKADVLGKQHDALAGMVDIFRMDMSDPADYHRLFKHLEHIEHAFKAPAQHLFYLSVPPQVAQPVVDRLGEAKLLKGRAKLLLEKPFGSDLASAEALIEHLTKYCKEEQIYRIDHFLAKEMAQNIIVFRRSNSLFQQTWNRESIESIDIVALETIGIEGRTLFYEQTGALRDIVQSHLLQLAALTLMDIPEGMSMDEVPHRRLQALTALRPPEDPLSQARRGQYKGYLEEVGNAHSAVETYVSLCLYSDDPDWEGVPIRLTSGKKLDRKATEIRIRYRQDSAQQANELILRISPEEGVVFRIWVKEPGYEQRTQQLPLELQYDHHFTAGLPDAYERVFVDAMRSDRALFTSSGEVLEAWRILAPVQQAWGMSKADLFTYEPGSTLEN